MLSTRTLFIKWSGLSRAAFALRCALSERQAGGVTVAAQRPSLRERHRQEVLADIRRVASAHLAAQGAAALSLRAVARDVGMAVSAMYRYYASRDELITDLLVAAFNDQADAVEAAIALTERDGPDVASAVRAAFVAYRDWSRAHPAEFGLAYGTPVPGYSAPAERTVRAGARVGDRLMALMCRAWAAGGLDPAAATARAAVLSASTAQQFEALRTRRGYDLPIPVMAAALDGFVRIHGFVAMEVFGHLRPITPDAAAYFQETLDAELTRLGLRA